MVQQQPQQQRSRRYFIQYGAQICVVALLVINTMNGTREYRKQTEIFDSSAISRSITSTLENNDEPVETRQLQIEKQSEDEATKKTAPRSTGSDGLLVRYGDQIYTKNDWDGAPIVIEKYKLLFFTSAKVGCTTWKQLFRRMMGISNYTEENYNRLIPWNPELNGLSYLYHYNLTMANYMMTSPEWTRAIFVRDPKERFVSAYLDKVIQNENYIRQKCCPYRGACAQRAKNSIHEFIRIMYICSDAHWNPQSHRLYKYHTQNHIEEEYWSYINFVGHMENIVDDSKRLLQQIGAWERYGMDGWGPDGTLSIFQSASGSTGRLHATNANDKLQKYISPEIELLLEDYYADDYNNPVFNLTLKKIYINAADMTNESITNSS